MSRTATNRHTGGGIFRALLHGTAAAVLDVNAAVFAAGVPASAQTAAEAPTNGKIPALGSVNFAWLSFGVHWFDPPPGAGHGPIRQDPAVPYHGNLDGPGVRVTPDIGDVKDPVLKPWAAKQMQESNEEVLSGKRGLPFVAQSTCYPGGVPGQLLTPAEPFYFIQTPKEVWMIWQRDHMVRRIYMTDQHSERVKPSWFGESIGHYESDGTLAVDTIGLSTRNSFLDWYRTPHSEKEHVTERFKILADDRLEALVSVEDPDTFNEPLHMIMRWRKVPNPMLETVCAENNGDFFGKNLFPIPHADKADF
jgi:hypothetical protein